MSSKKITVILTSFFILLGVIFMTYYYNLHFKNSRKLPILGGPGHIVGDFSFSNQDGKTITSEDVKGKTKVIEYFFTTCSNICPIMNEHMENVFDKFKNDPNFIILSHTVDPENDSIPVLKQYATKHGADGEHWMFLTGDKKALYDMARFSYLVTAVEENDTTNVEIGDDFIHSEKFILIDKENRIRGIYDGTKEKEVKKLIGDIDLLKEEDRLIR